VIHQNVISDELNNNNGNEAVDNRLILITAQTTEGKGNDVTRVLLCYNTKHAVLFVTNEDYLNDHQEPGWSLALIRGECAPLRLCGGSFIPRRKTFIDKEGNTTRTNGNIKCSVLLQRQSSAHITAYDKTRPVEF